MAITVYYFDGFDASTNAIMVSGDYDSIASGQLSGIDWNVESGGRNGGLRCRLGTLSSTTQATLFRKNHAGFTEFVMGIAIRIETGTISSATTRDILSVVEGTTQHLRLGVTGGAGPTYDLVVQRGTTVIATIAEALQDNAWAYIEIAGKIHDTTGYYRVWKDGVQIADASNTDTQNAGTGTCTRFQFGWSSTAGNNQRLWVDDYYCATVTSGPSHLGDVREAILLPSGAGTTTQFTPSAGSNYQNVDEATPNGDTDYNSTATVNNKDTFAMGNMPTAPSAIYGVKERLYARKNDAGSRTLRQVARVSGTDYVNATDHVLSDSYQSFTPVLVNSPATSAAWTQSEIDAMEHGYKVQA